jgi:hypothetical protein
MISEQQGARRYLIVVLSFFLLSLDLWGKRVPPKPVTPVVYNGIEYSAGGDGKVGSITAAEIATGKQLWTVQLFRVHIYFWKGEEDNQWVCISALRLNQNALLIKDERSHCYRLGLATKLVKSERCH